MEKSSNYSLVISDITMENDHRNSGFTDLPIKKGDVP